MKEAHSGSQKERKIVTIDMLRPSVSADIMVSVMQWQRVKPRLLLSMFKEVKKWIGMMQTGFF